MLIVGLVRVSRNNDFILTQLIEHTIWLTFFKVKVIFRLLKGLLNCICTVTIKSLEEILLLTDLDRNVGHRDKMYNSVDFFKVKVPLSFLSQRHKTCVYSVSLKHLKEFKTTGKT